MAKRQRSDGKAANRGGRRRGHTQRTAPQPTAAAQAGSPSDCRAFASPRPGVVAGWPPLGVPAGRRRRLVLGGHRSQGRLSRVIAGPADGGASFALDGSLAYGRAVGATSEIWLLPALAATSKGTDRRASPAGGDGRLYLHPPSRPTAATWPTWPTMACRERRAGCGAWICRPMSTRCSWPPCLDPTRHRAWPIPSGHRLAMGCILKRRPPRAASFTCCRSLARPRRCAYRRGLSPSGSPRWRGGAVRARAARWGSDLVVLLHPPAPTTASSATGLLAQVQEVPLRFGKSKRDGHDCLRDPAIGRGKRGLWLAFAATTHHADGEPARCELFTRAWKACEPCHPEREARAAKPTRPASLRRPRLPTLPPSAPRCPRSGAR